MKPITLEMTAFGSYARETVVDFQQLQHSLYLITGDTGAGKTTIFDGIMVALYGVASGKGDNRSRTFDIMHCDYVEKSVDTKVALVFSHMGKRYRVERTLHFKKKRDTGEYEKTTPTAILWEPDREPLEKTEQVTGRITELLGMNAEQFRKIAMLAQGEFKKFLDADSEEKNKILGELFDSSAYVYFQDLFDAARKKLEQERREKGTEQIRRVMEAFLYPEDISGEERDLYTAGHSDLEENLCRLVERDDELRESLKRQEQACRQQEKALHEKKGREEEQNRQLEEAAVKAAEAYEHACKEYAENEKRFAGLEKEQQEKARLLEEKKTVDEPVIAELAIRIDSLEKSLPRYGELAENRKRQEDEKTLAGKAGERKRLSKEKKERLTKEISALTEGIKELEGAEVRKERLAGEFARAAEELDRLCSDQGILAQVETIKKRENCLKNERDRLRELTLSAGELEAHYHELYQAFLNGQAGILAKHLERELTEQGAAVCPVCHTAFSDAHGHDFAVWKESTPEKSEVDAARSAFDEVDEKRHEQSRKITEIETAIGGEKENVVSRLRELEKEDAAAGQEKTDPGRVDWETLCREDYLDEITARYKKRYEEAEERFAEVKEQCRRLAGLTDSKMQKEQEAEACQKTFEESREEESLHRQEKEKLEAAAAELLKSMRYYEICPDMESVKWQKEVWEAEKREREFGIEQALALCQETDRMYGELKGILRAGQDALPKLEQEKEAAEQALLSKKREQASAQEATDLEQLEADIRMQAEKIKDLQEQSKLCEKQYENHKAAEETVRAANRRLQETEAAWRRLDELADLATGANGQGGRLSFDRYVMGYVFREILEAANRRLDIMSGGRYELVHEIQARRGNAAAGLEVSVLDMNTGKSRPSQSLSGGESFFVSLALALGLSDVVQNHAGGKQLDALFIDEGFGSLDSDVLDRALSVLNSLTQGNRLVGIISHVDRLEESIPQQIRVKNGENGSFLEIVQ